MVMTTSAPSTAIDATVPTMKAVRIHQFGPPDVIVYEDVPRPLPGGRPGGCACAGGRRRPLGCLDPHGQERPAPAAPLDLGFRRIWHGRIRGAGRGQLAAWRRGL